MSKTNRPWHMEDRPSIFDPAPRVSDPTAWSRAAVAAALTDMDAVDLSWLPASSTWGVAPDALRFLTALVAHLRPGHVLEFGSGISTRVLARGCRELDQDWRLSSLDHDPEWGKRAAREFWSSPEADSRVSMQIAPVVARECGGTMYPVYLENAQQLASSEPADLVLIDGPPMAMGTREGVLYQAMDSAAVGTLVLLDDASREMEKRCLTNWHVNLGSAIEEIPLPYFQKGLAAIIVRQRVTRSELWRHRVRLTREHVALQVPRSDLLIIAGEEWWKTTLSASEHSVCLPERGGAPSDEAEVVGELERLRGTGAAWFGIAWPHFWWFDSYPTLMPYLAETAESRVSNDRIRLWQFNRRAAG